MAHLAATGSGPPGELKASLARAVEALQALINALFHARSEPQWVRAVALLAEAMLEAMGAAQPHRVKANLLATLATKAPGAP